MLEQIEDTLRIMLKRVSFKVSLPGQSGGSKVNVSPGSDLRFFGRSWLAAYEELFSVAIDFLRPEDQVWDIGANVGMFTFAALDRLGDSGGVISIEPDPELSVLLSRSRLGLPRNKAALSRILTAAIAETPSILDLVVPINGSARNHLAAVEGNRAKGIYDKRACIALSADWLLDHSPPPNFVKIDVEGAEVSVLKGAARLLTEVRPAIYIEVNAENSEEVSSMLKEFKFALFYRAARKWIRDEVCHFNTLAVPEECLTEYFEGDVAIRGAEA